MNAELKQAWVDELRTTTVTQGRAELFNPNACTYCALGVLGLVLERRNEAAFLPDKDGDYYLVAPGAAISRYDLDYVPQSLTGLVTQEQNEVVRLNDRLQLPFPQIADWVEQNIPVTAT